MWMNEYEVGDAVDRFRRRGDTPNLLSGAETLERLVRWTNRNSDGWPYWQKPAKAADKLMDLLQRIDRWDPTDCSEAELKKALAPIKAFLTRHGSGKDDVFPPGGPVEYVVSVHHRVTAETPQDAARQMVEWLADPAHPVAIRVQTANGIEPVTVVSFGIVGQSA